MAKRKKLVRKKGRMRRWSNNPVPVSGAGPNANVVAEYKARAKTLENDPTIIAVNPITGKLKLVEWKDSDPPPHHVEEWASPRHSGYKHWHNRKTEVPGIVHYFYGKEHFLVKVHPATGEMKRSKIYDNPETMKLRLLMNQIIFNMEFKP